MKLLPHNHFTYKNIMNQIQEHRDICVVQGTGTGKSFLFMAIAEQLFSDKRILYVVPKMAVAENIQG